MDLRQQAIPTIIETDRLNLRRYDLDDDTALFSAARESINEVFPFLPWCHPDYEIAETRQWLTSILPDWQDGKSYGFAIEEKSDARFLGGIGLNQIDENPIANLGYWVRSSAIGQGVATEATRALAAFGLTRLQKIRIEIIMSVENQASRKVAENAGAKYEGILRNRLLLHGRCHDAHCYSLLRSDLNLI